MKLTIKEKVKTSIDSYVVELTAMFGDADGYSVQVTGGFQKDKDEELLFDLLKTCDLMKKSSRRDIDKVEGFIKWFDVDMLTEEEYDALPDVVQNATDYWLRDPQSHGEYYAALDKYRVFYYDENGQKHTVSIDK